VGADEALNVANGRAMLFLAETGLLLGCLGGGKCEHASSNDLLLLGDAFALLMLLLESSLSVVTGALVSE
jgi:hypothetical protein